MFSISPTLKVHKTYLFLYLYLYFFKPNIFLSLLYLSFLSKNNNQIPPYTAKTHPTCSILKRGEKRTAGLPLPSLHHFIH
jgi:hypothetical protein